MCRYTQEKTQQKWTEKRHSQVPVGKFLPESHPDIILMWMWTYIQILRLLKIFIDLKMWTRWKMRYLVGARPCLSHQISKIAETPKNATTATFYTIVNSSNIFPQIYLSTICSSRIAETLCPQLKIPQIISVGILFWNEFDENMFSLYFLGPGRPNNKGRGMSIKYFPYFGGGWK